MIEVDQLTSRLKQINGIESYLLLDRNGEILAHNIKNPDDLASMITIGGIGSEAIMPTIGCNHFRYLVFNRMSQRNFLVFPLRQALLGIQQISGTDDDDLPAEIIHCLEER